MKRPATALCIAIITGDIAVISILVVVLATQQVPGLPWIVSGMTLALLVVIFVLVFTMMWRPMFAAFPPQRPHPDAVRRGFQSFSAGLVNMGLSIHVAVDETHLHLTPLRLWQLFGATAASIPWTAIEPDGMGGRRVRVHVAGADDAIAARDSSDADATSDTDAADDTNDTDAANDTDDAWSFGLYGPPWCLELAARATTSADA